jgi:hypothetical protein
MNSSGERITWILILIPDRMTFPQARIYMTSFYNNYVASQVDFSFLNNSYQAYNGGAPYFNPGLNLLTKIGTVDLLENYKLTGGFRFSGNFDSNEYLVSLESLKGVWDKQLIFHRQAFSSGNDTSLYKIHSHNTYLPTSKPFSEAFAVKGTAIIPLRPVCNPFHRSLPLAQHRILNDTGQDLKAELISTIPAKGL